MKEFREALNQLSMNPNIEIVDLHNDNAQGNFCQAEQVQSVESCLSLTFTVTYDNGSSLVIAQYLGLVYPAFYLFTITCGIMYLSWASTQPIGVSSSR